MALVKNMKHYVLKTERKIFPLVKAKTEIIKFDNFNRPTAQGN